MVQGPDSSSGSRDALFIAKDVGTGPCFRSDLFDYSPWMS